MDPDDWMHAAGDEAGQNLMDLLLQLHYLRHLSAKAVCVIAWWAKNAGAAGKVRDLAFRPNAPSGHFQRHIDTVTGVSAKAADSQKYHVSIPMYDRLFLAREVRKVPCQPPLESISQEIFADPDLLDDLQEKIEANALPPSYTDHPVVQASPVPVLPLALYLDGVQFTEKDSVLGLWCYSLLTMKRHLIVPLRKSCFCRCGCRGWCTLWPVFEFIAFQLHALAQGRHPERRHDGKDWEESDQARAEAAGQTLPFRAAVVHVKGDLVEFTATLGLASWTSVLFPCLHCLTTRANLHNHEPFARGSLPWRPLPYDAYDKACAACEVVVVMTAWHRDALLPHLHSDKRSAGSRGRALSADYPPLQLRRGDRLEPCAALRDVWAFEDLAEFPCQLVWWRRAAESRARHRNPLLSPEIGLSPHRLALDKLHTVYLGVLSTFVAFALRQCIERNVFRVAGTMEQVLENTCLQLRSALFAYYRRARRHTPGICELSDLTPTMLGSRALPTLSAKAVETKDTLPFVLELLVQHADRLGPTAPHLLQAGQALSKYLLLLDASPTVVPIPVLDNMFACIKRFAQAIAELPTFPRRYKNHALMHMVASTEWHGNPNWYATFVDEGLNSVLSAIAGSAHRRVWEERIFAHFEASGGIGLTRLMAGGS